MSTISEGAMQRGAERIPNAMAQKGQTMDEIRRAIAAQQRQFDDQLADLRQFYKTLAPVEKTEFRAWLEKLESASVESKWRTSVHVHIQNDQVDERGKTVRWADSNFQVMIMLSAIKEWDAGRNYSPDRVMP
jgi:Sec-independent protein translocase protein TatA